LGVSRNGYYEYLKNLNKLDKNALLLAQIKKILEEDEENKNYGTRRMFQALKFKFEIKKSFSTVARFMRKMGLTEHHRKPKSSTKYDKLAKKSEDLLKRNFKSEKPNEKWVQDITEIPAKDGKLYVSGIFDCFDNFLVNLSMADNMRKELVISTLYGAFNAENPENVILHSDRGSQYTSHEYREIAEKLGIIQSMNSASGRCHDNAKCESIWARFKVEKIYQINTKKLTIKELKLVIFEYFFGYWNNRRINSAIGGVPPAEKRRKYYENLEKDRKLLA